MTNLTRRRALGLLSALAIVPIGKTLAGPAQPSAPVAPAAVYGAPTVAATDPAALSTSLLKQIASAGLPAPTMNVFPELRSTYTRIIDAVDSGSKAVNQTLGMSALSAPLEGDMVLPHGLFGKQYRINGLPAGATGNDFLEKLTADRSPGHVLSAGSCPCGGSHNRLSDNYPAFRVFAALHETAHFVSAVKGLDQSTVKAIGDRDKTAPVNDPRFATDIQERIADVTAILYLKSNYGDSKPYVQDVKNLRDGMLDPTHAATTSIDAGIAAFDKAPRKGLSIVEATQWATDIISNQRGLVAEYKTVAAASAATQAGTTQNLPAEGKAAVQKAVMGRRALFG